MGRTDRLVSFLEADPNNLQLISDAAEAALAENRIDTAGSLLARFESIAPLTDREKSLSGLVAIRSGAYQKAIETFEGLTASHPQTPALQYNLAWALAMAGQLTSALEKLDENTVRAVPQAAALKVELLHDRGEFDEAAALARTLISIHPDHSGLLAATSVLAMDVDDIDLARASAKRAGQHPDALTTLGVLSLGDDQSAEARDLFTKALAMNSKSPRALIGMGLTDLSDGNIPRAAENLERGAELFDSHVGSWIAAGWAQLLEGDRLKAEASFRRACDLDHNFAESQGSLAVLLLLTDREEEGRLLAGIARRLDPKSLTGSLAFAIALARDGNGEKATAIIERALTTPITNEGKTLAQAMSRLALGR